MQNNKFIFLVLTILSGCCFLYFFIDYQPWLAQGDHGRDLYAFEATLRGEAPYRDYWWVYGPLMPYYYSLFFKFLGTQIPSILIGKALLTLLSSVFLYLILSTVATPIFAFAGALWFLVFHQDFFFTYNHAGGITAFLGIAYTLFLYIKNPRLSYIYWGLLGVIALALIKLNFGISTLFVFLLSIFLTDFIRQVPQDAAKKQIYLFALFMVPPIIVFSYFALLYDQPFYVIRECFPYLKSDQQYYISIGTGISLWLKMVYFSITSSWIQFIFSGLTIFCFVRTLQLLAATENKKLKQEILLALIIPSLFYVVNLHEFIRSGVPYRSFWSVPFSMLLIFIVLSYAAQSLNRIGRSALLISIFLIIGLHANDQIRGSLVVRMPQQYLTHPRGKIFISNPWPWITTVENTSHYLETTLKENEQFFAFPYDPIYYFLTGRKTPTRQLIFFDHLNIPPEQEISVIADLEKKKINYLVVANRISARENGLGIFGETYCPLLKKYFDENFTEVQRFGDWEHEPGWAWNYGTKILKRK